MKERELTNNRTIPYYWWWRDEVLKRDKYTCQDCKETSGFLDVHHISSFAKDINKRFDPDNGISLCLFCHGRRHGHLEGFTRSKEDAATESSKKIEKTIKKKSTKNKQKSLSKKINYRQCTLNKAREAYIKDQCLEKLPNKHIERFHTPEGHIVEWSKEHQEFREWIHISGGLTSLPYTGSVPTQR